MLRGRKRTYSPDSRSDESSRSRSRSPRSKSRGRDLPIKKSYYSAYENSPRYRESFRNCVKLNTITIPKPSENQPFEYCVEDEIAAFVLAGEDRKCAPRTTLYPDEQMCIKSRINRLRMVETDEGDCFTLYDTHDKNPVKFPHLFAFAEDPDSWRTGKSLSKEFDHLNLEASKEYLRKFRFEQCEVVRVEKSIEFDIFALRSIRDEWRKYFNRMDRACEYLERRCDKLEKEATNSDDARNNKTNERVHRYGALSDATSTSNFPTADIVDRCRSLLEKSKELNEDLKSKLGGKKYVIPLEGGELTISLNSDLVHALTSKGDELEDAEEGSSKHFDADMYEQLNRLNWEEDAKKRILEEKDNSRDDNFNSAAADIEKYVKFLKSVEELNEPGMFGAFNSYTNKLGKDEMMNAKIKPAEVEVETFEPIANRNGEIWLADRIAAEVQKKIIVKREYDAIKANRNLKNLVQREIVGLPEFEATFSDEDVPPPPPISRSRRHENEVPRSKDVERRAIYEPAVPQTSVRRPASKTIVPSVRKLAPNGGLLNQVRPTLKTCSMPDRLETAQSRQMLHKSENYCESAPAQPEYVRPHREEDKDQDQPDENQHQPLVVPKNIDLRPGSDEVFRQLKRIKKNIFIRCRVHPQDKRAVMFHISWHFPCNLIGSRVAREWIPKNARSRHNSLPPVNCNLDGAHFQLNGIKRKWDVVMYPYLESTDNACPVTAYELPSAGHTPDYAIERIQLGREFVRDHVVAIDTDRELIQLVSDAGHAIWLPYQIRNKARGDSWPV